LKHALRSTETDRNYSINLWR